MEVDDADVTADELEIWYPGSSAMSVEITSPELEVSERAALGEHQELRVGERFVGRLYHRERDPNNLDHHVDLFLYPGAPPGEWQVTLGIDSDSSQWFDAWIERDVGAGRNQSRFGFEDAEPTSTTGTICNGSLTIGVGAYDPHTEDRELARFTSGGPTRDGRSKPDLVAPGVQILGARSASREAGEHAPPLTRKSGTSMAAPHVTGTTRSSAITPTAWPTPTVSPPFSRGIGSSFSTSKASSARSIRA